MRILRSIATVTFSSLLSTGVLAQAAGGQAPAPSPAPAAAPRPGMTLTSTAFADGALIPNKHTQAGEQVSPPLTWTNVPPGTQSFVLHMRDPEIARNRGTEDQIHWLRWNIPGTATGLAEGQPQGAQLPDGSQQISASGPSYRGPGAPAAGPVHHYTFELWALDTKLDVQPGADAWETRAKVWQAMNGHVLGKAVYIGVFKRPQ